MAKIKKWRRNVAESLNALSRAHERYDRRICDSKGPRPRTQRSHVRVVLKTKVNLQTTLGPYSFELGSSDWIWLASEKGRT